MNSRAKGKRGELALVRRLREYGFDVRRGQQFSGANGDADVVGLPGIHMECKWVEKLNIWDAYDQANRDAKRGEIPIVCHKKNGTKWLVSMDLDDWLEMYKEAEA